MRQIRSYLLIIALGSILFFPFLGNAHLFDWDEINFAETSREMVLTGNYTQAQVDFQQFWEKPPLFFWLQSTSMRIFGINEFAARFPNAICGILTLLLLFGIGKQLKDERLGWLWVACYVGSILPQFYFKSGIIDPWFNLFMFLGIYGFVNYTQQQRAIKWLFASGVAVGFAALTKGPVGIGIVGITIAVYFILQKFKSFPPFLHILYFIGFVLLSIIPWVLIEVMQNGTWFLSEFFKYQIRLATTEDASHGGFFGYHFVVILFFCFPASAFFLRPLFQKNKQEDTLQVFRKWMVITFWVVMILFSIVQTKIAHYSSMAYFPVTFLAAYGIYNNWGKWKTLELGILLFTGTVFCALLILIPYGFQHPDLLLPYFNDAFSQAALQANGGWTWVEFIPGIMMLVGLCGALYFNFKKKPTHAIVTLFVVAALSINLTTTLFTPKIERYSQGAMVDFFEEKSDEDAYREVIGLKSYAHLYYGKRQPNDNGNPLFINWMQKQYPASSYTAADYRKNFTQWLIYGDIDKPVYFATTVRKADQYKKLNQLQLLSERNGYVFFKRMPQQ